MKLVKISADWCKSCKNVSNVYEILKEEFCDLKYEEVDYDTIINKQEITKIPMFILYDNNKEVSRIISTSPGEIFTWIKDYRDKYEPLDSF